MDSDSEHQYVGESLGTTQRAVKARAACRARKSRCDTKLPRCTRCSKNKLRCDYEAPVIRPQSTRKNKSSSESRDLLLHQILERLNQLDDRISRLSDSNISQSMVPPETRQDQRNHGADPAEASWNPNTSSPSAIPTMRCSSSSLDGRTPYRKWWKTTLEDTLEWPILEFKGTASSAMETTMIIPRSSSSNQEPLAYELQDKKVIPHLVELFVEEVHTKNPILDILQIQKDTKHVLAKGYGYNEESCLVLLYCALGSISCVFSPSSLHNYTGDCTTALRYANHTKYFAAAQERFGTLWRFSRLTHAQGLFLAGVYLMYDLKPWQALETFRMASNSCYSHMMAVRTTKKLGMDWPVDLTGDGEEFEPSEQRLYWSCLKSETELAHEYGLEKSSLTQLTNPPSLPTPPNSLTADDIFRPSTIDKDSDMTLSHVQEKSWYYYLTEITLRKLEIQIHASFERLHDENWHLPIETMSDVEKIHLQDFLQCITSGILEFEIQLQSCWERLGSAMDINLGNVTVGCPDELAEYLRIKFFWIKHDLLRIALTMVLYFETGVGESNALTEFPILAETLFGMANRGLAACVAVMRVGLNTHRNHGSWFGPRITVMCALEVVAARKLGSSNLKVPEEFEDAAKSLVDGLKWWGPGILDASEYLNILESLDPIFESSC